MSNFTDLNKVNGLGYESIARGLVFDKTMSTQARFLYIYMTSKPAGWDFLNDPTCEELGWEERTLRKYVGELCSAGLLEKLGQTNNGKFGAVQYTLHPYDMRGERATEMPSRKKCITHKQSDKEINILRDLYINRNLHSEKRAREAGGVLDQNLEETETDIPQKRLPSKSPKKEKEKNCGKKEKENLYDFNSLKLELLNSQIWRENVAMANKISLEVVDELIEKTITYMVNAGHPANSSLAKKYFVKQVERYNFENPRTTLEERRYLFANACSNMIGEFGKNLVQRFFDKYSQRSLKYPNLMLFELMDGFEIYTQLNEFKRLDTK